MWIIILYEENVFYRQSHKQLDRYSFIYTSGKGQGMQISILQLFFGGGGEFLHANREMFY